MIRPIKHYTADDVREQSYALGWGLMKTNLRSTRGCSTS